MFLNFLALGALSILARQVPSSDEDILVSDVTCCTVVGCFVAPSLDYCEAAQVLLEEIATEAPALQIAEGVGQLQAPQASEDTLRDSPDDVSRAQATAFSPPRDAFRLRIRAFVSDCWMRADAVTICSVSPILACNPLTIDEKISFAWTATPAPPPPDVVVALSILNDSITSAEVGSCR